MSDTTRRSVSVFVTPFLTAVLAVAGSLWASGQSGGKLEQRVTNLEERMSRDERDADELRRVLGEINSRLSRIEGKLDEMRK